jgi:hypothetical protein
MQPSKSMKNPVASNVVGFALKIDDLIFMSVDFS